MRKIEDLTAYLDHGSEQEFYFGKPLGRFDQPLTNVTMEFGDTNDFTLYDVETNSLQVFNLTESKLGYWRLRIEAVEETPPNQIYKYERTFYLRVERASPDENGDGENDNDPDNSDGAFLGRESLIRGTEPNRPEPYVYSFDAKGLLTIAWSQKIKTPSDDLTELRHRTILVKGRPGRNLEQQ